MDTKTFMERLDKLCEVRYADMIKKPRRYRYQEFEEMECELDGMEHLVAALFSDDMEKVERALQLLLDYWKRLVDAKDDAQENPYRS